MIEEVLLGAGFLTVRKVDPSLAKEGAGEFVDHFTRLHGEAIKEEMRLAKEAAGRAPEGAPAPPSETLDESTVEELIARTPWSELQMHICALITDHLYRGDPHLSLDAPSPHQDTMPAEGDSEVLLSIKELLRTVIRPLLQEDGGDIRLDGFDEETGEMRVELLGACKRCGNRSRTLQDLLERTTQHWIPEVKSIRALEEDTRHRRTRMEGEEEPPTEVVEGEKDDDTADSPASPSGTCVKIESTAHARLVRRASG